MLPEIILFIARKQSGDSFFDKVSAFIFCNITKYYKHSADETICNFNLFVFCKSFREDKIS